MITTANLVELYQIINLAHGNPHHILGMHEVKLDGKNALAVRVFMPDVKRITVKDPQDTTVGYEMNLVHSDGFYEAIIKNRKTWFRYILTIEDNHGNTWTTYDPYSFLPVVSDLDLHLYGEGTHYEIFEKLGANITTVDGVQGTLFAVWAPNASRVSVVGSFNDWDGRRNPMRILEASGIWELFVPGVSQFDKYKFEIKTYSGDLLLKSDPYAKFAELRPGTASVVYDINNYKWNDKKWMDARKKQHPTEGPMSIYEVHLGSWKRVVEEDNRFLTYREMAEDLVKYVKDMGYTHIELMPVAEHPFDPSWGYQVTGFFAPTSRYGTPDDFKHFVDVCHQNNIGVILDWVPAHFPKDENGLGKFDGTALFEHNDSRQGEHPDWGTYIFNYGRKEVKNFLISNALFWLREYHIDALRVDAVASMLYLDYGKNYGEWVPNEYGGRENIDAVEFIKHLNSIVQHEMPEALIIAEESTAWGGVTADVSHGLGFGLKWNMGWMNDFLNYISLDPVYRKYHHNELTFSMVYAYTEKFVLVLSHDEVVHGKGSMIGKMKGDDWQKFANLRASYGFMFGHPGRKLLFMGNDIAQYAEWSEAKSIDWHLLEYDSHNKLNRFVKDLNELYKQNDALWANDFDPYGFEWIECNDAASSILSFVRKGKKDDNLLVFVCNFTPVTRAMRVGVPRGGKYQEILNSDNEIYGGSGVVNSQILEAEKSNYNGREYSVEINVPPLGVAVFRYEK